MIRYFVYIIYLYVLVNYYIIPGPLFAPASGPMCRAMTAMADGSVGVWQRWQTCLAARQS